MRQFRKGKQLGIGDVIGGDRVDRIRSGKGFGGGFFGEGLIVRVCGDPKQGAHERPFKAECGDGFRRCDAR
jgi:hypothetical protein